MMPGDEPVEDLAPLTHSSRPPPPSLFRDIVEAFTVAVVLALVIKYFVIEAYKVPTGSMEPTIHGAEVGGDRILINRMVEYVRDPRRWEIWVFRYPNNRRINYIKRVIGLPGESVWIINGDIYTSPTVEDWVARPDPLVLYSAGELEIARKPRRLQDSLFRSYPQVREEHAGNFDAETFQVNWYVPESGDAAKAWRYESGLAIVESEGRALARFRHRVEDVCDRFAPYSPVNPPGEHAVGDVQLALKVRADRSGGMLVFDLSDPHHDHALEARLPIAGEDGPGGLFFDGAAIADCGAVRLEPGELHDVVFTNADDRLEIRLDGEIVCEAEYRHPPEIRWRSEMRERIGFGVEGGAVAVAEARLYRDVHYRRGTTMWKSIPEGRFFVLGDNAAASKDSREWVRVTMTHRDSGEVLAGDHEAILDPDDLSSRIENPWRGTREGLHDLDGHVWFMDRYGNTHDLGKNREGWLPARAPSPLVPRDLFIGRAMAIFLPFSRIGIVR